MTLVQTEPKKIYLGNNELKTVYLGENKVRPIQPDYLCFTANTAGSTIKLQKVGSPTTVTLETSIDGDNRTTYTIGNTITLTNIGDKVYWRNASSTDTGFSLIGIENYYYFVMTGSIAGSGDVNFLLNKSSTSALSDGCFVRLFYNCQILTSSPKLPATTLKDQCYRNMFYRCRALTTVPELPATTLASGCYNGMFYQCNNIITIPKLSVETLPDNCYYQMFYGCSKVKLSSTQTGDYQTAYRIPTAGTGTVGTDSLYRMFYQTGGTWSGTPSINTTYYLHKDNTIVG